MRLVATLLVERVKTFRSRRAVWTTLKRHHRYRYRRHRTESFKESQQHEKE